MTSPIEPVVPLNLSRAKRVAKQFQDISPDQPLAACQATTSHLYGHNDWHALEQAVNARRPSAPFDGDQKPQDIVGRRRAQSKIICLELGGVTWVGGDNYVGRSLTFVLAGGEESEAA